MYQSNTNHRVEQMTEVQRECRALFARKNEDYGDSFAKYGPIGVIIRLGDKIERLSSITRTRITMVNDENVRDTLIDLHNYAAMAVMLMDEKKTELTDERIYSPVTSPQLLSSLPDKRPSSLPELDFCNSGMPLNPTFFPPMSPPGLLAFCDEFEEDEYLNAFKPVDIDKKRD